MNNLDTFYNTLREEYVDLFEKDRNYEYARTRSSPEALALRVTLGLAGGSADKDGRGVKNTCRKLGVACTYKAIRAYFDVDDQVRFDQEVAALKLRIQSEVTV